MVIYHSFLYVYQRVPPIKMLMSGMLSGKRFTHINPDRSSKLRWRKLNHFHFHIVCATSGHIFHYALLLVASTYQKPWNFLEKPLVFDGFCMVFFHPTHSSPVPFFGPQPQQSSRRIWRPPVETDQSSVFRVSQLEHIPKTWVEYGLYMDNIWIT